MLRKFIHSIVVFGILFSFLSLNPQHGAAQVAPPDISPAREPAQVNIFFLELQEQPVQAQGGDAISPHVARTAFQQQVDFLLPVLEQALQQGQIGSYQPLPKDNGIRLENVSVVLLESLKRMPGVKAILPATDAMLQQKKSSRLADDEARQQIHTQSGESRQEEEAQPVLTVKAPDLPKPPQREAPATEPKPQLPTPALSTPIPAPTAGKAVVTAIVNNTEDTVTGTGPAGLGLSIIMMSTAAQEIDTTITPEGIYAVDFTGLVDINTPINGQVTYFDPDSGYETSISIYAPFLSLYSGCCYQSGNNGQVAVSPNQATFTLKDSSGTVINTAVVDCGWNGECYNYWYLTPGQQVEMTTPGGETIAVTVPLLTGMVRTDTNVVSGQAPANQAIRVNMGDNGLNQYTYETITSPEGTYSLDFTPFLNILPGYTGMLSYTDPVSNQRIYQELNAPVLSVWSTSQSINTGLSGTLPNTATLTHKNSLGGVIETIPVNADILGWYYSYLTIQGGETLELTTLAGEILSRTIPVLTAVVSNAEDTVTGQAPANQQIEIGFYTANGWISRMVDTTPEGTYSLDLTGVVDLVPGIYGSLSYYDPAIGQTFSTPLYSPDLTIELTEHYLTGYTGRSGTLPNTATINIKDGAGQILASTTVYAELSGWFDEVITFEPGNTVELLIPAGPGDTLSTTVPILNALVHLASDQVTGEAPADSIVKVILYAPGGEVTLEGTSSPTGDYEIDFAGNLDITAGMWGVLRFTDPITLIRITVNLRAPFLELNPGNNHQSGHSGLSGATPNPITLTMKNAAGDVLGVYNYQADFRGYFNTGLLLAPGNTVELLTAAGEIISTSLPLLTARVNATTNTISGIAPPDANITVSVNTTTGWQEISTTTGSDGQYLVDFSTRSDIPYGTSGLLRCEDEQHYTWYLYFQTPQLRLRLGENYQYGYTGITGEGQHTALLTFYNASGGYENTIEVTADNRGYFYVYKKVEQGKRVELSILGGETFSVTIPPLTAQPDVPNNRITGVSTANTLLQAEIFDYETGQWKWLGNTTTGVDGSYTFPIVDANLSGRDECYVYQDMPDGNEVRAWFKVPYIFVSMFYSEVSGVLAAETDVQVFLWDDNRALKASSSTITDEEGEFWVNFYDGNTQSHILIAPGDQVEVLPQGAAPILVDVFDLSASVNIGEDIVSGNGLPNAPIRVIVTYQDIFYNYAQVRTIQTNAGGGFSIDFSADHDIRKGDAIFLDNSNSDGNIVSTGFYLPSRVNHNNWRNTLSLYSTVSAPATITLRDAGGTLKAQVTSTTSNWGYLNLGTLGDIAPGDQIDVTVGSDTTTIISQPLEFTLIDRAADNLVGTGPVDTVIGLYLSRSNAYIRHQISTNSEGLFNQELGTTWNLKGGDYARLYHLDANRNRQDYYAYVPGMTVIQSYNYVKGYGAPNSTVVVTLKDNAGNVKESQQVVVGVSSWQQGFWNTSFSQPILTGDQIEMVNAGMNLTITIPILTITGNPDTDVISGQAEPNSLLKISSQNNIPYEYYDTILLADGSGSYSLDISAAFNLQNLTSLEVIYVNSEGDRLQVSTILPGITGYITQHAADGVTATPLTPVSVELRTAGGALKASQTLNPSSNGSYATTQICNSEGILVNLSPTDQLLEAGTTVSLTIPTLTGEIDPALNTVSGTGPANAVLYLEHYQITPMGWYMYETYTINTDPSGNYSQVLSDITPSDHMFISTTDGEGDVSQIIIAAVNPTTFSTTLDSYPEQARPNAPVFMEWRANPGAGYLQSSYLAWDTESHACDRNYRFNAWPSGSQGNVYSTNFQAPAAGVIYVAPIAYISGYIVYGPEVAIPISEIAPVIVDPVNGTTNDSTPTLHGYAPAGETVSIYDGPTLLGSTIAGADAWFEFTTPNLTNGVHPLKVGVAKAFSNIVNLTVNNGLLVDPNHIFIYDRGQQMRIVDNQGYTNLGGRIWIRPNDTVTITVPITCSLVNEASLTVGSAEYELAEDTPGVWRGNFLTPSTSYAIIANITCHGTEHTILLTQGLIDPDGYVVDQETQEKMPGISVTCFQWDATSGKYLPWDAGTWGQSNPYYTDEEGYYSFIVPPGKYQVAVKDVSGYLDYLSPEIIVVDRPARHNIELQQIKLFTYLPSVMRP